jgi:hypothetical protein
MSTSPKDFMPAGEKKPKDIKVFDIGDQGQKKKNKHKKADAAPVAAAGGRKRAAFAASVVAALPAVVRMQQERWRSRRQNDARKQRDEGGFTVLQKMVEFLEQVWQRQRRHFITRRSDVAARKTAYRREDQDSSRSHDERG